MKVTCDREKLLHAFQTAAGVAPTRSPKQILQNLKLDVGEQGAVLMGTDLEVGIRMQVEGVETEAAGSVLLPIARMASILRESSDEKLELHNDGRKTLIRGQWSEFQLPSENPDEFPIVAGFEAETYHQLPGPSFREIVRRTIFATDNESSRYALGGVLLEFEANKITAVATDGRRLSTQESPAEVIGDYTPSDMTPIVPTRAMQLLERALAGSEEPIQVTTRENDILVRSSRATLYSRLVEGRFPKWRDVFPNRDDYIRIPLVVGPFLAAVRQAAIVTSEEHRGVDFVFNDGKVTLSGHGAEMGESQIELPIEYDREEIGITLDPRYVADFLRVLESEATFGLDVRNSASAVVCSTDDGYGYVIMPLSRDQRG